MKKLFVFFVAISMMALFFGCKNESADDVQPVNVPMEQKVGTTDVDYSVMLFSVYNLQERSLESLFAEVVSEYNSMDVNPDIDEISSGVRFLIRGDEVIVYPCLEENGIGRFLEMRSKNYPESEGWKSYGACSTEECVKKKLTEAAIDLSGQLKPGKCMELAVEKAEGVMTVYGRVKNC